MAEIIEFKCSNCGGPLEATGSSGKVVCPYCHTECVIDGLVKNKEILEKDNINSGVPMDMTKEAINRTAIDAVTAAGYAFPLDILENGEFVDEAHLCVPAYLFYCSGMASFSYEVGMERERTVSNGNSTRTERYTEWTPMSGSANASESVIAPGCRDMADVVRNVYAGYDTNNLIDIEELMLPADVEARSFNLPQPAAFGEYAKPYMEGQLMSNAEYQLSNKNYRNLSLGGCSVQKNEVLRLSLGLYKMGFRYKGNLHTLFMSGDGSGYCWDVMPVDAERVHAYEEKKAALDKVKSPFLVLALICAALGLFLHWTLFIGTAALGFFHFKRMADKKKAQAELDAFIAEADEVKRNFIQRGGIIKGLE